MKVFSVDQWPKQWELILEACGRLGCITQPLIVAPPATLVEVEAIEGQLGKALPTSLRTVCMQFSRCVKLEWFLPQDLRLPMPFRHISRGNCSWDLDMLPALEQLRQEWIACFSDRNDPYDQVWYDKLAFFEVGDGDMLAIDLLAGSDGPVIYLSHEGNLDIHGCILGNNFIDFIERWARLGCPGPGDWEITPFLTSSTVGLQVDGLNGQLWNDWFFHGKPLPTEPDPPPLQTRINQNGIIKCPQCGLWFSVQDKNRWKDNRHQTCGRKLILFASDGV
jgi:hypothetical protein